MRGSKRQENTLEKINDSKTNRAADEVEAAEQNVCSSASPVREPPPRWRSNELSRETPARCFRRPPRGRTTPHRLKSMPAAFTGLKLKDAPRTRRLQRGRGDSFVYLQTPPAIAGASKPAELLSCSRPRKRARPPHVSRKRGSLRSWERSLKEAKINM